MSDAWDDMRKAKEEEFFYKHNQAAIKRLSERAKEQVRPSPITGKAMKQVTYLGVNIDVCEDSGGIWLDKGEFEALLEASSVSTQEGGIIASLKKSLFGK